ncbi:MAG: hypothetical protein ACLQJR_27245 [Stellaceae bacterium]
MTLSAEPKAKGRRTATVKSRRSQLRQARNAAAAKGLTRRLVVLMTPALKKAIARKAAAAKMSAGELIRRSIEAYEPEARGNEILVRELLSSLKKGQAEALQALDEAEAELQRTRDYFAAKREREPVRWG